MFKKGMYAMVVAVAFSCSSKEKPREQEILSLKEMNELVTVEYVVNKIIKASDDKTWYKIGDRKILMTCEATLKAGIDFSKINTSNINIKNKEIILTLPHATLFSINIKPEGKSVISCHPIRDLFYGFRECWTIDMLQFLGEGHR